MSKNFGSINFTFITDYSKRRSIADKKRRDTYDTGDSEAFKSLSTKVKRKRIRSNFIDTAMGD